MEGAEPPIVLGHVAGVYGIKGWLKLKSYTDPPLNAVQYLPLSLRKGDQVQSVAVVEAQERPQGLVVQFEGFSDRTAAEQWLRAELIAPLSALPPLPEGEYYWHQLVGLSVYSAETWLGEVVELLETGANDVLVVREPDSGRERLIPYLPEQVVTRINLAERRMDVDWDPEF